MIQTLGSVPPPGRIDLTTAEIQPVARAPLFNQGEVLKGFVLQTGTNNRVLLQIGTARVLADAQTPLKAGEQLTLRVEETGPRTVLQILGESYQETQKINQYLLLNRSQPQSLRDLFLVLRPGLDATALLDASPESIRNNARKIAQLMETLVFSSRTMNNPGFVKDYIQGLGFLLEHGLFRALDDKSRLTAARSRGGVKGGLLRFTELLQELTGRAEGKAPGQMENIGNLLRQSQSSITAIEIQQVLNVLSQEEGRPCFIPIPMAFPDGVRFQDLYIEKEPDRDKNIAGTGEHRFVLFLDLDILGEMMAEVRLADQKVNCRIKCREEESRVLIASALGELKDRLEGAGLKVGEASCYLDPDLARLRQEFRREHGIDMREALSLYA